MVTTGDTGTVSSTMLASSIYTAPGTIGSVTANSGAFTTLSASSTVSGAGFTSYFANPPAIGGSTPAAGKFSTLTNTALTSGRVVYSTTGGLETDSANLLFDGTTLTANSITSASATALTLKSAGTTGVILDTNQNFQLNSGYGSVSTVYGCRAWATFNGNTSPATINASGGITSITKNSTGNYTVNFSFTFPDANYAAYFGIAGGGGAGNASFVGAVVTTTQYGAPTNKTTTVCQIQTNDYTASPRDFTQAYVAFIR